VNADGAVALQPDGLDHAACAPLCEGAHYALCALRAANVRPGQQALVNGATGAIGLAAVQLARNLGATVTGVADTPNMELVRSLGATTVIDRLQEDPTRNDDRFDLVFDAVGKSNFGRYKHLLKPKGIYLSTELRPWSQNPLLAMVTPLLGGQRVLFPMPKITQGDAEFLAALAADGTYRPVIDRHYSGGCIVEAHRYVDTGEKVGNVVVRVGGQQG
jgi:NADPH:quinone reductase-like Zn-dependent oxidoreductase